MLAIFHYGFFRALDWRIDVSRHRRAAHKLFIEYSLAVPFRCILSAKSVP